MTWLLGAFALTVVAWLWRKGMEPAANDLSDPRALARMLRILLSRGIHKGDVRASLTIQLRTKAHPQLVFRKYIDATGQAGVRAVVTHSTTPSPPDDRFRAELVRRGIAYAETADGFSLDIGRDFGLALVATQVLFQDVAGGSVARDCVAYFRDVVASNSPALTGVDAPDDGWG